jgi:hypothetical protein
MATVFCVSLIGQYITQGQAPGQTIPTGGHPPQDGGYFPPASSGSHPLPVSINPNCLGLGPNGGTTSVFNTTGANFIAVTVSYYAPGGSVTVTDNKGNGAPFCRTPVASASQDAVVLCFWQNPTVGAGHTFTVSGTSSFSGACVEPFSNMATTATFDTEALGSAPASANCTTGTVTPSAGNKVLISGFSSDGATGPYSIGSGFTADAAVVYASGVHFGLAAAHLIQTPNGAPVNPTWTGASGANTACNLVAFKGQ